MATTKTAANHRWTALCRLCVISPPTQLVPSSWGQCACGALSGLLAGGPNSSAAVSRYGTATADSSRSVGRYSLRVDCTKLADPLVDLAGRVVGARPELAAQLPLERLEVTRCQIGRTRPAVGLEDGAVGLFVKGLSGGHLERELDGRVRIAGLQLGRRELLRGREERRIDPLAQLVDPGAREPVQERAAAHRDGLPQHRQVT